MGGLDFIIEDVDAPNYMTSRNYALSTKTDYLFTIRFRPVQGGTMFATLYGWPNVKVPKAFSFMFRLFVNQHVKTLAQIVHEEIAAGRIQPEKFKEMEGKKGEHHRPSVDKGRFAELTGENG